MSLKDETEILILNEDNIMLDKKDKQDINKVKIEFTQRQLYALQTAVQFMKDDFEVWVQDKNASEDLKKISKALNQNFAKLSHNVDRFSRLTHLNKKQKVANNLMVEIMEEFDLLPIAKRWVEEGYEVNGEPIDREEFNHFVLEYKTSKAEDKNVKRS